MGMGFYDADDNYVYTPSYDDLIEQDGIKIEARESFGDYYGENVWVVSREQYWGWYTDSYGSCSGCDALEACDTREEVDDLGKGMRANIHWFPNKDSLVQYLIEKDHEVEAYDYYGIGNWLREWAGKQVSNG